MGLAQSLSMDWRQSGAWLGLTPDWHLIDAPVIQLGSPMIFHWHRFDIWLTSDWPWIVIGMAPDLLDWHRLAMIWHWICNELTPRWWGFAALWLLIYISLTIDMVINTGLISDWQWISLDWHWIDVQLTLDCHWIILKFQRINFQVTLAWQPISAGLT